MRFWTYTFHTPLISDRNYEHYRTIIFDEEYVSLLGAPLGVYATSKPIARDKR